MIDRRWQGAGASAPPPIAPARRCPPLLARLFAVLEGDDSLPRSVRWLRRFGGAAMAAAVTGDVLWGARGAAGIVLALLLAVEFVLRLLAAPCDPRLAGARRPHLAHLCGPLGLVDLLVVLPGLCLLFGADLRELRLLRLVRVLAIPRRAGALRVLLVVLRARGEALLAAGSLVLALLLVAAVGIHRFEAAAQPEAFGTVADALWWAVVTLTTVGYGDVVPKTPGGRLFAGLVMIAGVLLVALPTAILTAGFVRAFGDRRGAGDVTARTRPFARRLHSGSRGRRRGDRARG